MGGKILFKRLSAEPRRASTLGDGQGALCDSQFCTQHAMTWHIYGGPFCLPPFASCSSLLK